MQKTIDQSATLPSLTCTSSLRQKAISEIVQKGYKPERVQMIASSIENAIRRKDPEIATAAIVIELQKIIETYGARKEVASEVLKECVKLIREKFGMLEINEIREAYRAYAVGEIEPEGAEMYGGQFNVQQIGRILSAWVDYRRAIYADVLKSISEEQQAAEEERKREERQREFNENFESLLQAMKEKCRTFHDVPEYLYQSCMDRRLIEFEPGEAHEIFREAFVIAGNEIKSEAEQNRLKGIMEIFKSTDVEKRAKAYARKMSVFKKVLCKP